MHITIFVATMGKRAQMHEEVDPNLCAYQQNSW